MSPTAPESPPRGARWSAGLVAAALLADEEAAEQMQTGALDGGILDRARTSAERTVRALIQSLGFERVVVEWKGQPG